VSSGSYTLQIKGTGADGKVHSTLYQLTIGENLAGFSLRPSSENISLFPGLSASLVLEVVSTGGYSSLVTLSASQLPAGLRASFDPENGYPPFRSVLILEAGDSVVPGDYQLLSPGGRPTSRTPVPCG
jgi:hypothetical protein